MTRYMHTNMNPLSICFTSFLLFINILLLVQRTKSQTNSNITIPYHVGVILDSSSSMGQMANTCISMGITDFYAKFSSYKTRLVLHNKDSQGDPLQALSQAVDLLQNYEVQAIIGPQTSQEAEFLVSLGVKAEVPIVSFSATSPFVSHAKTQFFVRVANNDNFQVKHIATFVQTFRWREIVLIYEDSTYGYGIVANLVSALDEVQVRVPYRSIISPFVTDTEIVIELYKLMIMSNRVFVVHLSSSLAYRVFLKVNELGMMSKGYAWIVTEGITSTLSSINSSVIASMQGVIGIRSYLPPSNTLNDFFSKWSSKFLQGNQSSGIHDLDRYCLWAYDAVWALAVSAEKLGIENLEYNTEKSLINLSNLTSIPISQTGSKLLKVLLDIRFDGVSGPLELEDGERKLLPYEIINIVGGNLKRLGYKANDKDTFYNETVLDNFTSLVWPGGSIETPRGWVTAANGKQLRIGIPVRTGFQELVKVERDLKTNTYKITGFCVDVFQYAIELLGYDVPYEFIPFVNTDGTVSGDYNDLIYQVYLQKFDGVVGDITITSNRSLYVDFTLPFTEGGIACVIPTTTVQTHSMWVFLEPLTVDLWLVILSCFILTGIIVWAIECQGNNKLKGPVLQQFEKIFSHSVSSLVFAPGENLIRSFSKFVVIVWLFAAFIIAASYTASLSSLLTTRQLLQFPKGGFIGYRPPSFATKFISNLNFENTHTKPYKSDKDYADALKKGSLHGGVSAIIDEIPYIKLFLAKYHDGYTMVNPKEATNGFGFVFPKQSRLVADLSEAIAKLRESGKLEMLQKVWFGNPQNSYIVEDDPPETNVLGFYNFRGLFLIMGITLILALVISHLFLYTTSSKGKEVVNNTDVAEQVLPCDSSVVTLVISDSSSDDNISVDEGDNVTPTNNHLNGINNPL